jgi:glycosyltransferase involved in cell wall biosynthesis
MRVLFLIADPEWTGSARAFVDAARALAVRSHEVAVAARGDVAAEVTRGTVELTPLPASGGRLATARHLRRLIEQGFVEVVFVHAASEQLEASLATRMARRGTVVRRVRSGERLALGRAERTAARISPNAYVLGPAAALVPTSADEVSAEIGVSPPADSLDLTRDADGPRLVCLAGRGALPRAARVLRAVALLRERHPRLELTVAGPAAADADLRMQAAALGLAERARWSPSPASRNAALDGVAAGFVVADGDDAVYGYLDLMARRVPVIAERTPLAERYVADGIYGALLPELEPARMAAEVAVMLASAERREAMGSAARARVARDFNERSMAAAYEQAARAAKERARWRS